MTWLTKADTICHGNEWLIRLGNSKKYHFPRYYFRPLHSPPTYCTQTFQKHLWEHDAIKFAKEGKGWGKGMVFTRLWQFFVWETVIKKSKISAFPHVQPEIPPLQILPLLSAALGPWTSDLSLLPYFLHLYNEDKDTCLCYTVSVTIH